MDSYRIFTCKRSASFVNEQNFTPKKTVTECQARNRFVQMIQCTYMVKVHGLDFYVAQSSCINR